MPLYAWQHEALKAWIANGRRGVVEAVTGAGKTRLGLHAVDEEVAGGGKALIVVPTTELLHQWQQKLARILPQIRIGRAGDGSRDQLKRCDVLVATLNVARGDAFKRERSAGLLVVDECHRCGSEVNRLALAEAFASRLGLSATHARTDGAHASVIEPYFEGVVYRMGYTDAIAQGVIARFAVALVAVGFEEDERAHYDYLTQKVRKARARLIDSFGVPGKPFGEFMKAVNRLRVHGDAREAIAAGQYLAVFNRRRELLAETAAKHRGICKLEAAVRGARRVIVFTQTVRGAELVAAELVDLGIDAEALHSDLARPARRDVLARFARGHLHAIVAPQVLDEGLDVPDADLGVIVAASRQQRQMIQRMGRVLRPKDDGRLARFAILYVEKTSEDPMFGAHETFLDDITASADAVCNFDVHCAPERVCAYLNNPVIGPRL